MDSRLFGKREKVIITLQGLAQDIEVARDKLRQQDYLAAMDIYEQLSDAYPAQAVDILAEVYDVRQTLPSKDRYTLYQSRCSNFGIRPGDKVLDIGSGHIPFPFATHLSDIAVTDDNYGRGGTPFKHVDGKPVYEFNVENIPFADNEFDFVYCSHVLEHSESPEKACQELMRVGKRGYVETPSEAKDLWLNSAKVSNHKWAVEIENDALVFKEYTPEQTKGLACNILMSMHCSPQTKREKAFSVLIHLKPEFFNTMLLWDGEFEYRVKRNDSNNNTKQQDEQLFKNMLVLIKQGDFENALKTTEVLASSNVHMPEFYFARAVALSRLGEIHMAESACRAELQLYPGNVNAENFLRQLQSYIAAKGQRQEIGCG